MKLPDFRSIRMSRPRTRVLYGVKICKMPCGRYLDVLETLGGAVYEIFEAAFPGMNLNDVLEHARRVKQDELKAVLVRIMGVAPRQALAVLARILDTDEKKITDEMTPAELLEVVQEFARINDYQDFFVAPARCCRKRPGSRQRVVRPALDRRGPDRGHIQTGDHGGLHAG